LGDFYLEAVFIITEVANIFRPLLCVHFDKNGLGYFMGDFYKLIWSPSGLPDNIPIFKTKIPISVNFGGP
jgi:hypothetical protein